MGKKQDTFKLPIKLFRIASILAFVCCVVLLFPQVRQFIVRFVEQHIIHREFYEHSKWIKSLLFIDFSIMFIIASVNIFLWNTPDPVKKPNCCGYFNNGMLGINGFLNFCRTNVLLIFVTTVVLFFTYGVILFHTSIQMDTAYFTGGGRNSYNWPTVGRFGLVALQKLWSIKEFNPYTAAFAALLFLELSAIAWCYLIELFSKQDKRNYKLIPFAVLYMSMPMWIEHFIGLLQAAEVSFIVFLCPVIIFLFYKGIFDNEKIKILIACALLFFIASVYQGILPMFLCGVFICFILFQDNSNYEKALYRNVAIKLFVFVVVSVGLYFFVNKFCFLNSDYLDNMNSWGKQSFKQNVLTIFNIAIDIFKISDPHNIYGSIILLPATVLFIIKITCNAIKNKQKDRLLYILAGLCIPLCILLLTISGANKPPLRSMYVLPLATAFMPYYLLTKYKPAYVKLLAALMLVVVVFQIQVSVQIQYSDYLRYINDIHIAYDLDRMIRDEQDDTNSLPIAIIPQENTRTTLNFNTNYLRGEISGTPFLQWLSFLRLGFMQTFGINYAVANEAQTAEARIYAENMSAYPDKGCVKRYNGIIVIKLSE